MQFSDHALDELRALIRDEFHEEITRDQAAAIGTRLVELFRLLLRPLPRKSEPLHQPF